jgi:hypothetical protein
MMLNKIYQDINKKEEQQYINSLKKNSNVISPVSTISDYNYNNIIGNYNIEFMNNLTDNDSMFSDNYSLPQPKKHQQYKQYTNNQTNKLNQYINQKNNFYNDNNSSYDNSFDNSTNTSYQNELDKPCETNEFLNQFDELAFDYNKKMPNTYNNSSATFKITNNVNVDSTEFNKNKDGRFGVTQDMTHNNMLPQFKSKTYGYNPERQHQMDEMMTRKVEFFTGSDQDPQFRHKKEVNTMFKPDNGYIESVSGMPNFTNFFQSRVIPSDTRNGERPIEPIKTTPGLNLGYYETGQTGFQDMFRPTPKTVDQLRVLTDPKVSYTAPVKPGFKYEKGGIIGEVSKKGPDSFYTVDPSSIAPNRSNHIAPRQTGNIILDPTSRTQTAETTHLNPISNREGNTPEYLQGQFATPFKQTYETDGPRNVTYLSKGHVIGNYTPTDTQRSTNNEYIGTTVGNYKEMPLVNFINAVPDTTLKEIILEDNGRKNIGIISNKINGYLFNKINSIPDPTLRSIISDKIKFKTITGNQNQSYLFNATNATPDTNMRNLTENNIYVKPISNKEQGYLFDYANSTPDLTLKNLINACWGSGGKGMTGNYQNTGMFNYQNATPNTTLRELTENNINMIGTHGNQQKSVNFNYNNGNPDITLRNLTENNVNMIGTKGNQFKNINFNFDNGNPDITMRNLTENNVNIIGTKGNQFKNINFNFENGNPDITMRNLTENNVNILGTKGNNVQLRSRLDASNALVNSNREIVLTKREGENGCKQTEGKTAFFTEYEFCDDKPKNIPIYGGNRLLTSIKNELFNV